MTIHIQMLQDIATHARAMADSMAFDSLLYPYRDPEKMF